MDQKYYEAQACVEFFADTLSLTTPVRVVADDGAPMTELLEFCHETGMSLDWAFCGDLRPMVRATFEANTEGATHV